METVDCDKKSQSLDNPIEYRSIANGIVLRFSYRVNQTFDRRVWLQPDDTLQSRLYTEKL